MGRPHSRCQGLAPSDRRAWGRAAAFVLIAGWILLSPAYVQILGRRSRFVRPWVMFRGSGVGLVDAEFYLRQPDGTLVPLDRFATLGYAGPSSAPDEVRRIRGEEGLRQATQSLAEALGTDADLRVRARLAGRRGWVPLADPSRPPERDSDRSGP